MSDVVNFKPKKTGMVLLENDELFDFDAWLAQRGLSRTMVNELYAERVTDEGVQAPEVVVARKRVEEHQGIVAVLEERAARARSELRTAVDEVRNLEAQVILAKCLYLGTLMRRAQGIAGDDDPTEKPKRGQKSRRS